MTLADVLMYASGLFLVAPDLDAGARVGTSLAVLACDAAVCRLFAYNNGYPRNAWTLLGLVGGLWAVAVLILLPRRGEPAPTADRLP